MKKIKFPAKVEQISAKIFLLFLLHLPLSADVCEAVPVEKSSKKIPSFRRHVSPLKASSFCWLSRPKAARKIAFP